MSKQNQKQKSKYIQCRTIWEKLIKMQDEEERLMEEFLKLLNLEAKE